MYLSDNLDNPTKYQIIGEGGVNTVIEPYGYLVIWADKLMPFTQLHAPFKLAAEGGYVTLTVADRSWRDVLYYEPHQGIESVGLYPDGGNDVYVMTTPTIAKTNIINNYAVWQEQPETPEYGNGIEESAADVLTLNYREQVLYIHSAGATSATLVLYSAAGIKCMNISAGLSNATATFDLAHLAEGTYIAIVTDSNGNTEVMKLNK